MVNKNRYVLSSLMIFTMIVMAGAVSAATTISYSGVAEAYNAQSLVDTTGLTQADTNTVVEAAITGLTPVALTLASDEELTGVRFSPVGAGANIQLWAKDTSNNWYDINVDGWGSAVGFDVPAGYSETTDVYILSDAAGTYTLAAELIQVSDSLVLESVTDDVIIDDGNAPTLTTIGATVDGNPMSGDLATGFVLYTDRNPDTTYNLDFSDATTFDEPLATQVFDLTLVSLDGVAVADLEAYYTARKIDPYLSYLVDAANGNAPFAYVRGSDVALLDGAHYFLASEEVPMIVPGDYPLGTYTLQGDVTDRAGNPTTVTLKLVVADTPIADLLGSATGDIALFTPEQEATHLGDADFGFTTNYANVDTLSDEILSDAFVTANRDVVLQSYYVSQTGDWAALPDTMTLTAGEGQYLKGDGLRETLESEQPTSY